MRELDTWVIDMCVREVMEYDKSFRNIKVYIFILIFKCKLEIGLVDWCQSLAKRLRMNS